MVRQVCERIDQLRVDAISRLRPDEVAERFLVERRISVLNSGQEEAPVDSPGFDQRPESIKTLHIVATEWHRENRQALQIVRRRHDLIRDHHAERMAAANPGMVQSIITY